MTLDLLTEIYSSFEPFQPPSKEVYVDCQEVRGGWEVVRELGRKITRSKKPTCQLYSGHRGVGKSTELLRLKEYLEQQKYFVVYFAADGDGAESRRYNQLKWTIQVAGNYLSAAGGDRLQTDSNYGW